MKHSKVFRELASAETGQFWEWANGRMEMLWLLPRYQEISLSPFLKLQFLHDEVSAIRFGFGCQFQHSKTLPGFIDALQSTITVPKNISSVGECLALLIRQTRCASFVEKIYQPLFERHCQTSSFKAHIDKAKDAERNRSQAEQPYAVVTHTWIPLSLWTLKEEEAMQRLLVHVPGVSKRVFLRAARRLFSQHYDWDLWEPPATLIPELPSRKDARVRLRVAMLDNPNLTTIEFAKVVGVGLRRIQQLLKEFRDHEAKEKAKAIILGELKSQPFPLNHWIDFDSWREAGFLSPGGLAGETLRLSELSMAEVTQVMESVRSDIGAPEPEHDPGLEPDLRLFKNEMIGFDASWVEIDAARVSQD